MKLLTDLETVMQREQNKTKIWKLVLTGGPCGGKTTGQSRISTFFENLGWKVYRVPETATVLISGGVNFADLSPEAAEKFQENLLKTMIQMEDTYFDLANAVADRNVLVICDRGTMDASAFISREQWERILARLGLDEVEMRDNRYNQVIHMVTAAKGAEQFYTVEHHAARSEGLDEARERDTRAAEAWVGHPYVDIVDNSSDFETKINNLITRVAWSMGLDVGDRLRSGAKKVKFVVNGPLPGDHAFPSFRDFTVHHHYLQTNSRMMQSRLRKRGRKGKWSYTHTIRKQVSGQMIEVKIPLTHRDYSTLLSQEDSNHFPVYKTRRCFLFQNQYFQMDIYKEPCHGRCKGLMLLETYTTLTGEDLLKRLPPFLNLGNNVTGDSAFSMFNLSLRDDWANNKKFCHRLSDDEDEDEDVKRVTKQAQNRLDASMSRQSSPNGSQLLTPEGE
ncbi:hypothetical protein TCAL_03417 [Tigriopus californicus]|uniref:NadR/Ttd14 AAA domain-containing protein n=1 Tax=Tigriopus californicus TaxID=6832 RepID=A0A553P1X3_TIGCA|nr:TRPL translocation defect protein 14-like [Tigriopus californicus]XP_059086670.1 TRPL translocation defect protein 14-like [Tigriopus californicus]TRY71688.1 hypothetical protein TCAL_03417 [Tigriopus californicus]|eukprot:TCALIF_03417-PA protein Name:"Protein of unknown function" AED:0.05 eAED:0.05 QI:459/1/1/1/1/1/7/570/447